MKIFISADIEGVATTAKWAETRPSEREYPMHCEEMTEEVLAACHAAIDSGATEILIKDAHGPATNIDARRLPECVSIVKGWEGHPYMMVQGIDPTFDAAMFIGYHSEAGGTGNPMSHTMTTRTQHVKMNGSYLSEFELYSLCAVREGVPTVFLSGDRGICERGKELYPWLVTAAVKEGRGDSVICKAPKRALHEIYEGVKTALSQDLSAIRLPAFADEYAVEIEYKEHTEAARMAYFPGMERIGSHTVRFVTRDFYEAVRTLKFTL